MTRFGGFVLNRVIILSGVSIDGGKFCPDPWSMARRMVLGGGN
jgi:hypothetical protein